MDSVAQTHKHTHPHKLTHTCRALGPTDASLHRFFCVLHPVIFFNVERSIQFVLILSATKHQLVKSKDF